MDNILIQSYKNLLYYDPTSNKMFHNLNKVLQTSNVVNFSINQRNKTVWMKSCIYCDQIGGLYKLVFHSETRKMVLIPKMKPFQILLVLFGLHG